MIRLFISILFAGSLVVSGCSSTDASSAADRAVERYLESTEGIESFAVVSDDITVYHRLAESDSMRIFQPVAVQNGAPDQPIIDPFRFPAVQRLAIGLRESGSLDSTFTLEDESDVMAYSVEDPSVMLAQDTGPMPSDVTKLQVLIDASTFDIRGINGTFLIEGYEEPVQEHIAYDDYTVHEGLRLPSQTIVRVEGLDQMFTDEQKIIMQGQIGAQRERAKLLPPESQQQLLDNIREQEMLLTEGAQETQFEIKEVRVGEPMPDALQQMLQGAPPAAPTSADSIEAEPATS